MKFLFGMVTFYTKESAPELLIPFVDVLKNAFTTMLCDFKASVVFPRSDTLKEIKLLYAFAPEEEFPKADDAAVKQLTELWEKESGDGMSAHLETFDIRPLSEKSFIFEINTLFLYATSEDRVAIQEDVRFFKTMAEEDLSAKSLRMVDIVLSYQPPEEEAVPLKGDIEDFADGFRGETETEEPERKAESKPPFFERLDALTGLSEFKAYMKELETTRPYLIKWKGRKDFPVQHLLFAVDSGNGCSTAIEMLHEYLAETELYGGCDSDCCDLKKKEHHYGYPVEDAMQAQGLKDDLDDFEVAVDKAAPGVMAVHIEEWLGKMESPYFSKFLDICREYRHDVVFVFIVPYLEEGVLARVRSRLSDVLNVRLVRFHPYTADELTQAARLYLSKFDIGWDASADVPFQRLLAEERRDNLFYGMRTVDKLGTELVLMKAKNIYVRNIDAPADRLTAADFKAALPSEEAGDGFEKLDKLIGLTEVKKRVRELVVSIQTEKELAGNKDNTASPCLHMMFTGSPGTGKTTVARLIGQIFREAGLLQIGDLVEVSRFDLVGEFIGTTGPKTVQCCRGAMGSILFIDEAYLLSSAGEINDRDFGKEALGALVAEMENSRDRFMVIMAGYGEEMDRMLKSNPGLRGRVPHILHFPNYSRDELVSIFRAHLREYDFDEAFIAKANAFFQQLSKEFMESKEFGNARFVRNLVERLRIKALLRLQGVQMVQGEKIRLTTLDLESALADEDMQAINKKEKTARIGFAN